MSHERYASLTQWLEHNTVTPEIASMVENLWPIAYNAGVDASRYAIESHLHSLRMQLKEMDKTQRPAQEIRIAAVSELHLLLQLYRKVLPGQLPEQPEGQRAQEATAPPKPVQTSTPRHRRQR